MTRNIQRDIVAAPLSLLGLNNGNLYGTQGKKHIHALMDHGYIINTTGHHLRDLTESHKLEIGCSGKIFSNNLPALYGCISPFWISHTWKFMRDKNLSLEEGTVNLQPQRQKDSFIMGDFIAACIKGEPHSKINRCHIALHATCRSDISTVNGKAISLNAIKGKKN